MQYTLKPNPLNVNFFLDALIFFQDSKMELLSGKRMGLALIHQPLGDEARRQGGPITKATPYSQEWAQHGVYCTDGYYNGEIGRQTARPLRRDFDNNLLLLLDCPTQ